ncbi:MAG: hypothetical protein KTR30_04965 [Saprospiraceae bacterium]|nr:hypothetical protein [Saprospiraceae bacterium]
MELINQLRNLACLWGLFVVSPLFGQFIPENNARLYLDRAINPSSVAGVTEFSIDGLMKLDYLRLLSNNNLVGIGGVFIPHKTQGTATGKLIPLLKTGNSIEAEYNSLGNISLNYLDGSSSSQSWINFLDTPYRSDSNQDDFLDVPLSRRLTGSYQHRGSGRNYSSLSRAFVAGERQISGQLDFKPSENLLSNTIYGFGHHLYQLGGETRLQFHLPTSRYSDKKLNVEAVGFLHDLDAYVGTSLYKESEQQVKLGVKLEEGNDLRAVAIGLQGSWRSGDTEFGEQLSLRRTLSWYGLKGSLKDYLLLNLRLQANLGIHYHDILRWQILPNVKLDYQPSDQLDLRIAVFGEYNYRFSELWNENRFLLQSARKIDLPDTPGADKMWKFGAVLQGDFDLDPYYSDWLLSYKISYCHWYFPQKMILDLQDPAKAVFRETKEGASWDRVEAQLGLRIRHNLMVKSNYTYQYSTFQLDGVKLEEPFSARHHWMNTVNWLHSIGSLGLVYHLKSARLFPDISGRDLTEVPGGRSPWFHRLDVNLALHFKEWIAHSSPWHSFNLRMGVRNVTGLKQPFPLLAYQEPFGGQFDASLQWGSVYGAQYYLSLNYDL